MALKSERFSIDTVFLDAGGVVVFPNWWRVSETLGRHGITVDPDALAGAEPIARRRLDVGGTIRATRDADRSWLYFDLILEAAGLVPCDQSREAFTELHAYHAEQNLWEHVPADVVPGLEAMRAMGLRLVVVSNANGRLRTVFDRLDLSRLFDVMLDSYDEGVEKPDPRLFRVALERSGAVPERTVHVGDLYHVDVVGARAAGIFPVLLDAAGLSADRDCCRVASLEELVSRLAAGTLRNPPAGTNQNPRASET